MEQVTVASKGQIAIPKTVRYALNLSEGTKLTLEVRGQEIVLSKEPAWRKLQGAGGGRDLISAFAAFKKQEREHEDSRFDSWAILEWMSGRQGWHTASLRQAGPNFGQAQA